MEVLSDEFKKSVMKCKSIKDLDLKIDLIRAELNKLTDVRDKIKKTIREKSLQ